jgi:hypothetical protein
LSTPLAPSLSEMTGIKLPPPLIGCLLQPFASSPRRYKRSPEPWPFYPQHFAPSSSAYPCPEPPNTEHRRRVPFLSATGATSPPRRPILASVSSAPSPSPSPRRRGELWCRVAPLGELSNELRASSVPPVHRGPWRRLVYRPVDSIR